MCTSVASGKRGPWSSWEDSKMCTSGTISNSQRICQTEIKKLGLLLKKSKDFSEMSDTEDT